MGLEEEQKNNKNNNSNKGGKEGKEEREEEEEEVVVEEEEDDEEVSIRFTHTRSSFVVVDNVLLTKVYGLFDLMAGVRVS